MASILTGTPIPTQGVHPLAALMGQGTDVLARSFGMAANRMTANNSIAVSMMRDAMQEKMEQERMRLTREKMEQDLAMQQAAMDQRDRHFQAELASREKIASDRLALAGRKSSLSAQQGQRLDMGGMMSALLGQSFSDAGGGNLGPPPPEGGPIGPPGVGPQAPIEGPTLPPQFAQNGGASAGPNLPIDAYGQDDVAQGVALREAKTKAVETGEVDALGELYKKQAAYYAIAAQMAPTASSQLMYGSKAIQSMIEAEKWKNEKAKGATGDLNGLAIVDKAINDQLDPFAGFAGKPYPTPQDLDGIQDPATKKALAFLNVDSTALIRDLNKADASIDQIGDTLDVYNKASDALLNQERRSQLLAGTGLPAGTRSFGAKVVSDAYHDQGTIQGRIHAHRDALEEEYVKRVKEADLAGLSPRTLAGLRTRLESNISSAEAGLKAAETVREDYDKKIGSFLGNDSWGRGELQSKLNEVGPKTAEESPSAEFRYLMEMKKEWEAADDVVNRKKIAFDEARGAASKVGVVDEKVNPQATPAPAQPKDTSYNGMTAPAELKKELGLPNSAGDEEVYKAATAVLDEEINEETGERLPRGMKVRVLMDKWPEQGKAARLGYDTPAANPLQNKVNSLFDSVK